MSTQLPGGIEQAFMVAAGELGMCSAAWLFTEELGSVGGEALVTELRDALGRTFPVLDYVAARWLQQAEPASRDPARVLPSLQGINRLLVVGLEARFLDALLPSLPDVEVSVLAHASLPVDWERVLGNLGPRVQAVDYGTFQRLAGHKSALLTFLYGVSGQKTHVIPEWLRVMGADVRTQFRAIVGWNVLADVMAVYPRWLVECPTSEFSHLV